MPVPVRPRDFPMGSSRAKEDVVEQLPARRRSSLSSRRIHGSMLTRRNNEPGMQAPVAMLLMMGLAACTCRVSAQPVEQLRVLVPLYARPEGDFWKFMVESGHNSTVSFSVVINPNSGPGDSPEEVYTTGMNDLIEAGVEVLCYVPTGFGTTDVPTVTADIDTYESFYPQLCGGYFFDEGPGLEEGTWKYTDYYSHVQAVSGPGSTVVINPGIPPHESLYNVADRYAIDNPNMGGQLVVTSFENKFERFYDGSQDFRNMEVPFPPRYLQDRYLHSALVYAAYFATLEEFLEWTVFQLFCANWGYVFFTDDSFGEDGNPWDELPSYFAQLLAAAAKAPESAGECGTFAPTTAPTAAPTLAPLAPGETRPPLPILPTPSPTELSTPPPAAIGETRAPSVLPPTPAPTPSPTPSPTAAPTVMPTMHPTAMPTPVPTPVPVTAAPVSISGAPRRGCSSSFSSPATLLSGAALLATVFCHGYGVPLL